MLIENLTVDLESIVIPKLEIVPVIENGNQLVYNDGFLKSLPAQDLPVYDEFVFQTDAEMEQYIEDNPAPSLRSIFDTWPRADGARYIEAGSNFSGNAGAWYYDNSKETFIMPRNVVPLNSILSLYQQMDYEFSATLSSTDSDNDSIGIVLAAVVEDNSVSMLLAMRHAGGISGPEFTLEYFDENNDYTYSGGVGPNSLNIGSTESSPGRWSSRQTTLSAKRTGSVFEVSATRFGSSSLLDTLSVDVSEYPQLQKFMGRVRYGFTTFSQPDSFYSNVNQPNAAQALFSLETGKGFDGSAGSWRPTDQKISDRVGWPSLIRNPVTNKMFFVHKGL